MTGTWRAGPVAGEEGALRAGSSSTPPSPTPPARDASVIWHEAECGGYSADLPLWTELAAEHEPVLEIGCGTGRVSSYLTRRGYEVHGLDSDPKLIEAVPDAVLGDARDFDLGRRFGLVLAPMQLLQLFDGPEQRLSCLSCIAAHLHPGGLAAFAIVESMPEPIEAASPLPDTREVDGWVYSSLPVDAQVDADSIRVRRLRQTVSPGGELADELVEVALQTLDAPTLEDEASEAGFAAAGRRVVPPTDAHVGSTVVLLEKEA